MEALKVKDDILGYSFSPDEVRNCPHPGMIRKYGDGNHLKVSVWVCKKCKLSVKDKFADMYKCTFGGNQMCMDG